MTSCRPLENAVSRAHERWPSCLRPISVIIPMAKLKPRGAGNYLVRILGHAQLLPVNVTLPNIPIALTMQPSQRHIAVAQNQPDFQQSVCPSIGQTKLFFIIFLTFSIPWHVMSLRGYMVVRQLKIAVPLTLQARKSAASTSPEGGTIFRWAPVRFRLPALYHISCQISFALWYMRRLRHWPFTQYRAD